MIDTNKFHTKKILRAGKKTGEAEKALIMIHGRGANAHDILSLADYLQVKNFALLAPEATNNTWYPYSFMAPVQQNEPWLSSSLEVIKELVKDINAEGIISENIYFLGFSQGACLTLEFVARNAMRYGGVVAFTGRLNWGNYSIQKTIPAILIIHPFSLGAAILIRTYLLKGFMNQQKF